MSAPHPQDSLPAFIPVVVGGDIGAYSLARAFHEAYGLSLIHISEPTRRS